MRPEFWWLWAWRLLTRWSALDLDALKLTVGERWGVVAAVVPAALRALYVRPAIAWGLSNSPWWMVRARLEGAGNGWYRIPSRAAADHVRLRFDIYPIDAADHVRVDRGRLVAVGYVTKHWCEILMILPNGEIEPDPKIPGMAQAWSAYRAD